MQVVRNILLLLLVLPLLVVLLMPKKELYYLLEQKLEGQNIVISGEALQENLLGLTVEHPTFYLGGAPVATAKEISLWSMLFYTQADFDDLRIAEGLPTAFEVQRLRAVHSVLSPFKVSVSGESSLGTLHGEVQLKARMVHIQIAKDGDIKAMARYLKKHKEGWVYESKF